MADCLVTANLVTAAINVGAVGIGNGGSTEVLVGILTTAWINDAMGGTVDVDTAVESAVGLLTNEAVSCESVVRIAVRVVVILIDCVNVSDSNTAV